MWVLARLGTLVVLSCSLAFAGNTRPNPSPDVPVEALRAWNTYKVEADGRYTYDSEYIILIRTEGGAHESGSLSFPFNASQGNLEVVEAYTETPEGELIAVPPDNIVTRERAVAAGAPMFADAKVKTIVFPQVVVHSKLHYHLRQAVTEPLFPGFFGFADFIAPDELDDDDKLTVYAASGVELRTDLVGFRGGAIECPLGLEHRHCYSWTARNTVFSPREPGSVASEDYGQHALISNFPTYEALGKAYLDRTVDKTVVSPKIKALAGTLTKGMSDPRAQAEALFNWVARNIRYVAVYVGDGSVVPHSAETVLDNRYGDCKDHVVLLQSLLRAQSIDSVAVLIATDHRWKLPSVPVNIFNHVITFIPSLHLYVDSTSEFSRFGQLPETEIGKAGLKVAAAPGTKQLESVESPLSENHMVTTVTIRVKEDGGASGTAEGQLTGSAETGLRGLFAGVAPGGEDEMARAMLTSFNESGGTGTFTTSDPRDLTQPFVYRTSFSIPRLLNLPGPGAFRVPTGLRFGRVADLVRGAVLAKREYPWECGIPGGRRETIRLSLPPSVHLDAVPRDLHLRNAFGSYDAHYEQAGSGLLVTREFAHALNSQPCNDNDYQQFRQLAEAIERDAQTELVFH